MRMNMDTCYVRFRRQCIAPEYSKLLSGLTIVNPILCSDLLVLPCMIVQCLRRHFQMYCFLSTNPSIQTVARHFDQFVYFHWSSNES